MSKIKVERVNKDEFVSACADLIEELFPKGQTVMRGEANVLIAKITLWLMEKGVVDDQP